MLKGKLSGQMKPDKIVPFKFGKEEAEKKFLEFTNLPIKEVASRCGFKTAQHFSRKFEDAVGTTPGNFRSESIESRKRTFCRPEV